MFISNNVQHGSGLQMSCYPIFITNQIIKLECYEDRIKFTVWGKGGGGLSNQNGMKIGLSLLFGVRGGIIKLEWYEDRIKFSVSSNMFVLIPVQYT